MMGERTDVVLAENTDIDDIGIEEVRKREIDIGITA